MTQFGLRSFLIAFHFVVYNGIFAQNPTFQKIYRDIYQDQGLDCIQTINGHLIAGWTRNSMGSDGFLIRTNWQGDILWHKFYGGPAFDLFRYLTAANDGGFLAYGGTGNLGNLRDVWLVKTDEDGNLLWQKRMGAPHTSEVPSAPIIPVTDGYLLSGELGQGTTAKLGSFITKVDNNGETLWSRLLTIGDQSNSAATKYYGIYHATDTALYATGTNGDHAVFVRLDPSTGDVDRVIEYRSPLYKLRSFGLRPTHDGNLMIMGMADFADQTMPRVVWALKARPDGEVVWSKTYMANQGWLSPIFRFSNVSDGGFILSLEESQINGDVDLTLLIKIDADGEFTWKRVLPLDGNPNKYKYFSHIFEDSTGQFVSTGWINNPSSEVLFVKTNPRGETSGCCSKTRNAIPPVDFPVEAVEAPFEQSDYLPFEPADLSSPQFQSNFVAEDICLVPQPTLHDTLRFCPGESVTLGDSTYAQPATVSLLIPSATDDCDTLATYTLEH
ncbi:MAG: hypothetical protein KF734_00785 [Saprospiraceae bacterium]|nr:hypothetical protein [Saprospiraceae bacterium]